MPLILSGVESFGLGASVLCSAPSWFACAAAQIVIRILIITDLLMRDIGSVFEVPF